MSVLPNRIPKGSLNKVKCWFKDEPLWDPKTDPPPGRRDIREMKLQRI